MNIKPLGHRLVLKSVKRNKISNSGIYIGDTNSEDESYGEIIAAAKDADRDLQLGQLVIYDRDKAKRVKDQEFEYIIIEDKDILAVVED